MTLSQERSQAVFERVRALGGIGVCEGDMVVISLDGTGVTDDDLAMFGDCNFVEILVLSNTNITDAGLVRLQHLGRLDTLMLINTNVTEAGVAALRAALPNTHIETETIRNDTISEPRRPVTPVVRPTARGLPTHAGEIRSTRGIAVSKAKWKWKRAEIFNRSYPRAIAT
jgi:hypothetical protein